LKEALDDEVKKTARQKGDSKVTTTNAHVNVLASAPEPRKAEDPAKLIEEVQRRDIAVWGLNLLYLELFGLFKPLHVTLYSLNLPVPVAPLALVPASTSRPPSSLA
jgi:hypothetical protein